MRAPEVDAVIARAVMIAREYGWPGPVIEHLVLALLELPEGQDIFAAAGANVATCRAFVDGRIRRCRIPATAPLLAQFLNLAEARARASGRDVLTIPLLIALLVRTREFNVVRWLERHGVDPVDVSAYVAHGTRKPVKVPKLARAWLLRAPPGDTRETVYRVVMYNDDFTTREFVERVLVERFGLDADAADELVKTIHHQGRACVGTFGFRVATKLVAKATREARSAGFPLRLDVEPA